MKTDTFGGKNQHQWMTSKKKMREIRKKNEDFDGVSKKKSYLCNCIKSSTKVRLRTMNAL